MASVISPWHGPCGCSDGHIHEDRRLDVKESLVRALAGECQGIARLDLDHLQRQVSLLLELDRIRLEVVEQVRIEGIVVGDVQHRLPYEPQLHTGGAGEPENDRLAAFVLQVLERGDREGLLRRAAAGERQRAGGDGDVVAFGCGGAGKHRVVDGDLLRVFVAQWATEAYGHRRGAALGDAEAPGGEGHRQRRHAGRSEQRHLVEEVAAGTAGVQRAEGPAMDLGQRQAVVRRAVADVLAREAGEREAELPPAREVVGEGDREALGVVLRGAGVPVVEDVHEQGGPTARPIQPEREAFVADPVLRRPGGGRGVGEVVHEARERRHVQVCLEDGVRRPDRGEDGRRRGRGGERRGAGRRPGR